MAINLSLTKVISDLSFDELCEKLKTLDNMAHDDNEYAYYCDWTIKKHCEPESDSDIFNNVSYDLIITFDGGNYPDTSGDEWTLMEMANALYDEIKEIK